VIGVRIASYDNEKHQGHLWANLRGFRQDRDHYTKMDVAIKTEVQILAVRI
jgi:hypothetical protein